MLLRLVIFFSIIFLPISSFAECNFNTSKFISELNNPKYIKYIEIEIPKSQRYVRNFLQTLSSSFENKIILSKYKQRFFAKINVEYEFGRCEYEGKVRQSGDWPDHIKVENGNPVRSLDVRLNKGNILNAVKFKTEVLWAQLDALYHSYVEPGNIPPGCFIPEDYKPKNVTK